LVVVLPKYGIAYFPMRKVASTSVKDALRRICDAPGEYHATFGVPMSARQRRLAQGHFKFTIVRDPIARILSCYGNRVVHHRDLSVTLLDRTAARLFGRSPEPGIDEFCRYLRSYRALNDKIRRHTRPQYVSLGEDLGFFDAVYTISELDTLASDLTTRTGRDIGFDRLQTAGPKFSAADLSPAARRSLLEFTRRDYDLLGDFFRPPESAG